MDIDSTTVNMWFLILSVFIISFLSTWLYRLYAIRKSVLDIPNDRSSHTTPTPRGGGIAIALSWFIGLVYFVSVGNIESNLFYAFLSGLPLALIGLADDIFGLNPLARFKVQFISAGLGLFFLGGLQIIDLGFTSFNFINSPFVFYSVNFIAFIAIIWLVNLFNFLDGIDGYIGTELIFIGLCAFLLTGDKIGLLLAAAVSGFLIWNWPKAKIFMGDVGSTLLGFIVAMLIIYYQNQQQTSIVVWLILTSVFWFDATVTLIRRFLNHENLSEAHRKHAFQRIVQAGYSHKKTVLYSLVLNFFGLGLVYLCTIYKDFSLLFLAMDVIGLTVIYRIIEKKRPFECTL